MTAKVVGVGFGSSATCATVRAKSALPPNSRHWMAGFNKCPLSHRQRKKIEMLFAHLKRILRLDRLRLGGPNGTRDEFHLAATAQNLRKLAKRIPMPLPKLA